MFYEILIQLNVIAINSYSNAKLIHILPSAPCAGIYDTLMSPYKDKNVVFNTTNKRVVPKVMSNIFL